MMKKYQRKITFSILIFVTFFLASVFVTRNFANTKVTDVKNNHVIKITSSGFKPRQITVPQNSNITFLNEDQTPHWIASDNHPTHEQYPEFDLKRPLDPGESWQFSFKRVGSWSYHDHLNPDLTGRITILENETSDKNNVDSSQMNISQADITSRVKKIAFSEGAVAAWEYFKKNYTPENYGSHDVAHYIGSLIFQQKGIDGLDVCDFNYAFGCYHGVLEEQIKEEGINNLNKVVEKCHTLPSQSQLTCYHGIGHGILPYYKYDLIPSLALCDTTLPSHLQIYCYNGVFMENAIVNSHKTTADNPHWPCNTVEEKFKSACYGYQMVILSSLYKGDPARIAKTCSEAGQTKYIDDCIRGLGHQIAQMSLYSADKIIDQCGKISGDLKYKCQVAAAGESIFQRQPYEATKSKLCDPLPNPWLTQCINSIDTQKSLL